MLGEQLRELKIEEIKRFSSRKGVKKTAVENFLLSVHNNITKSVALDNLFYDAKIYKWNAATVRAILDGINLAVKR